MRTSLKSRSRLGDLEVWAHASWHLHVQQIADGRVPCQSIGTQQCATRCCSVCGSLQHTMHAACQPPLHRNRWARFGSSRHPHQHHTSAAIVVTCKHAQAEGAMPPGSVQQHPANVTGHYRGETCRLCPAAWTWAQACGSGPAPCPPIRLLTANALLRCLPLRRQLAQGGHGSCTGGQRVAGEGWGGGHIPAQHL